MEDDIHSQQSAVTILSESYSSNQDSIPTSSSIDLNQMTEFGEILNLKDTYCWICHTCDDAEPFRSDLNRSLDNDNLHQPDDGRIVHPMDFNKLYSQLLIGKIDSLYSFVSEVRWMAHNYFICNGGTADCRSVAAKQLLDLLQLEIDLLKACPSCFLNRLSALFQLPCSPTRLALIGSPNVGDLDALTDAVNNRLSSSVDQPSNGQQLDPMWFSTLCDQIHPLVWVRLLKSHPKWPAKVMRQLDNQRLLLAFFGDYDVIVARVDSVQLHSKSRSVTSSSIDGSSSSTNMHQHYQRALLELGRHLALVKMRHVGFSLPQMELDYTKSLAQLYYYSCLDKLKQSEVTRSTIDKDENKPTTDTFMSGSNKSTKQPYYSQPVLKRLAASISQQSSSAASCIVPQLSPMLPSTTGVIYSANCQPPSLTPAILDEVQPPRQRRRITTSSPSDSSSPPLINDAVQELQDVLQKFRSEFSSSLSSLEEKWTQQPFVFKQTSTDVGTQTDHTEQAPMVEQACQTDDDVVATSIVLAGTTTESRRQQTLKSTLMEREIHRLDLDNQRLRLLVAHTRYEMLTEMKQRAKELRQAWEAELKGILERSWKAWQQDMIRVVDSVKRNEWCANCGNLAFYYCCWNTCYCDTTCQLKHWSSHYESCVQTTRSTTSWPELRPISPDRNGGGDHHSDGVVSTDLVVVGSRPSTSSENTGGGGLNGNR